MQIEIIGMGCPACNKLYENARKAASQSGIDVKVIKVDDLDRIAASGILSLPALVIDGVLRVSGRNLAVDEILRLIKENSR